MRQKKKDPIARLEKKLREIRANKWTCSAIELRKLENKLAILRREHYDRRSVYKAL